MINIKKIFYLKSIGLFILLELAISFITGLLNLLGLNSSITKLLILISNLIIFTIYGYKYGKKINKKGYITGSILGISLISILFISSIIIYNFKFKLISIFYYSSLLIVTIIGSILGKNHQN